MATITVKNIVTTRADEYRMMTFALATHRMMTRALATPGGKAMQKTLKYSQSMRRRKRVAPLHVKVRRLARKAMRFFALVDAGHKEANVLTEIAQFRRERKAQVRKPLRVAAAARQLDPSSLLRSSRMDLLSLEAPDYYASLVEWSREHHVVRQILLTRSRMTKMQLLRLFCVDLASCIRRGVYTEKSRPLVDAVMLVARGYCHPTSVPALLGLPSARARRPTRPTVPPSDEEEEVEMFVRLLCQPNLSAIHRMFDALPSFSKKEEEASLEAAKRIAAGEPVSPWQP
jgi:hypothetical protein